MDPITIYGDKRSGNCFKVQLTCALLGQAYHWHNLDVLAGDTRKAAFLAKSTVGKMPIIELADGRVLSESNAIINYLAHASHLNRSDPWEQAKLQQWQFFEQYSHEPYIAVARFIKLYLGMPKSRHKQYEQCLAPGYQALDIMETQLSQSDFMVDDAPSTADICLYAYTHVAHDGGFDLTRYPHIDAWFDRIEALPNYVAMSYE
jgi:glutathione S-transferase